MPDETPMSGALSPDLERILLKALLEHLPDSIYFKDRRSRFLCVNCAKATKMGFASPAQIVGQTDFDHFTEEHAAKAFADEQQIIASGEPLLDCVEKETWTDGSVTWVSTTKLPLRDLHGRIIGTFGVSRDITERRRIEEENEMLADQLGLAQKLESVGRLSAGIAHEINTPGQFVADNLRFLATSLAQLGGYFAAVEALAKDAAEVPALAPQLARLAKAADAADLPFLRTELPLCITQSSEGMARIARIVGALKDFAHPRAEGRTPADLASLIATTIDVSRHEWRYCADLVTEFAPNLPAVPVVVDEINQALLNLVVNAAQAVAAGIKQRGEAKGRIAVRTRLADHFAVVEIEDNGTGIPDSVRPHLFEPFVTTKRGDKAPGQGLNIVYTIIRHHGGRVEYETTKGRGSTFRVFLPLTPPVEPSSTAPAQP